MTMTLPATSVRAKHGPPETPSDVRFFRALFLLALGIRLGLVGLLRATDAVFKMRLSPDSERYHRDAVQINRVLEAGGEVPYAWEDSAWFRFTALVYRGIGNHSISIQLLNVTISALTAVLVYHVARRATGNLKIARMTGLITALNPALIYWSCLMLKDPTATFAMTAIVAAAIELRERFTARWLLIAVLALVVFLGIRSYMFMVLGGLFVASLVLFRPLPKLANVGTLVPLAAIAIALPIAFGHGAFGIDFYRNERYFDLEYINHIRVAMGDHGNGRIFDEEVAIWGDDVLANAVAALRTAFYFFFVVDLTNLASTRQLMALPEAIFILLCFPAFVKGIAIGWKHRGTMFPILLFGAGVMSVYISATTNMGALFRWKMQVMPLLGLLIATGMVAMPHVGLYRKVTAWADGFAARDYKRRIAS